MSTLYEMTQSASRLYDMLMLGEIDEETFSDTCESIGVADKIDSYCKVVKQLQADEKSLEEEIDRLTERKNSCKKAVERMKGAISEYLSAVGKEKEKTTLFTVYTRKNQSAEIKDESKIPQQYLIPQPDKIDKQSILADLKAGKAIDGAELVTKSSINIR